jgi:hypothetical protein
MVPAGREWAAAEPTAGFLAEGATGVDLAEGSAVEAPAAWTEAAEAAARAARGEAPVAGMEACLAAAPRVAAMWARAAVQAEGPEVW